MGQALRLKCSVAVREGLEAEKVEAQSAQRSLAALGGAPDPGGGTSTGSRWPQYHSPLPLTALARTCINASYRFLATASSAPITAPAQAQRRSKRHGALAGREEDARAAAARDARGV